MGRGAGSAGLVSAAGLAAGVGLGVACGLEGASCPKHESAASARDKSESKHSSRMRKVNLLFRNLDD